jgi:hypothetical protein
MITDVQITALNPEMAAAWLVGMRTMSKAQYQVLVIACRNGGYVEAGTGTHKGCVERVSASALSALIRRGDLTEISPTEGGLAGQLSTRSRAKLTEVLKKAPRLPEVTGTPPQEAATPQSAAAELAPGNTLYRVIEVDLPDDRIHTWKVENYHVTGVRRDGSFTFDRIVGSARVHKAFLLGMAYHRTPEAAVMAFAAEQRAKIASAQRSIAEAARAIEWAKTLGKAEKAL